jgi:hypothetical protein
MWHQILMNRGAIGQKYPISCQQRRPLEPFSSNSTAPCHSDHFGDNTPPVTNHSCFDRQCDDAIPANFARTHLISYRPPDVKIDSCKFQKQILRWDRGAFTFNFAPATKLISTSEAGVVGTHHGVGPDYLTSYLAEYFYWLNRRNEPQRLFSRAVRACVAAKRVTYAALFG